MGAESDTIDESRASNPLGVGRGEVPGSDSRDRPAWVTSGHVPCLDGMRAVSIGLVLIGHFAWAPPSFEARLGISLFHYGSQGVDVFFVISGFLITLLLFREVDAKGQISLGDFYTRRALRIMPAYLSYLGFVFLLTRVGLEEVGSTAWATALTYTTNLRPGWTTPYVLAHTWSLSLEEHFYLLWPPTLALLGRRRSGLILALAFAATPAIRYALLRFPALPIDVRVATPTRMAPIIAGCLLAYLVTDPRGWPWIKRARRLATGICLASASFLLASNEVFAGSPRYDNVFRTNFEAIAIAIGIFAVISNPRSMVGIALSSRPLVAIGILSYSLYLWQQPFSHNPDVWMRRPPQNLLLAVAAAICSHLWVERPFLRLKARLGRDG